MRDPTPFELKLWEAYKEVVDELKYLTDGAIEL